MKRIDFRKGSGTFVLGYMMMIVCLFIGLVLIEQFSMFNNAANTQMAADSISDGVATYASTLRGMDIDEMYDDSLDRMDLIADTIADNTNINIQKEVDIDEDSFKNDNKVYVKLTNIFFKTNSIDYFGHEKDDPGYYEVTKYSATVFTNSSSDFYWPLTTAFIASPFGWRQRFMTDSGQYSSNNHGGVDIDGSMGQPIYAVDDGTVSFFPNNDGAGNMIQETCSSNGIVVKYMHCSGFNTALSDGASVKKGTLIGYVGSTGNSTGPHLHLQTEFNGIKYNPFYSLYNGATENLKFPNNGVGSVTNPGLVNSYGTGLLDYEYYDASNQLMYRPDGTSSAYQ